MKLLGQRLGARARAVGHQDVGDPGAPQVPRGGLRHLPRPHQQHALAVERSENLARQFHRRIAHRNRALPDLGLRAHALGDVERARHHQVQESVRPRRAPWPARRRSSTAPGSAARPRSSNPDSTPRGTGAGSRPARRSDTGRATPRLGSTLRASARNSSTESAGVARFLGRDRHLHAIAGRKNHAFHHARPLAQTVERLRQRLLLESQLLAHLHRRGVMIQACDQQLHGISVGLSPACATQVSAPQPSTTSAINGRFAPAPSRRRAHENHRQAQSPGHERQRDAGVRRPSWCPVRCNAHITPKITPSVMKHEAEAHRTADQVVERPQRRQLFEQRLALLALQPPFLDQIEHRRQPRSAAAPHSPPAPEQYGRSATHRAPAHRTRPAPAAPSPPPASSETPAGTARRTCWRSGTASRRTETPARSERRTG